MNLDFLEPDERFDIVNESLSLIQKKDGLTFGSDAYLLAAYMYQSQNGFAVELGGGTGIISLLLKAKARFKEIAICEIQDEYCRLISRNAELNGFKDIRVINSDVRQLSASVVGAEADAVFSNPPYMKADSGKKNECQAKYIARHEVCGGIDDFCACACRCLKYGGKFYVVYRPDRLSDLMDALRKNTLEPKRMTFVQAHASSAPSMVLVEAKKGAAPSLVLSRPLILYKNGENEMSDDAKKIYENCSFEEFFRK